jgi:hypothetical protein
MNKELLWDLKREFGTVSSQTETSGVVAVRNITARRRLAGLAASHGHELMDMGTTDRFPRLVRVIQRQVICRACGVELLRGTEPAIESLCSPCGDENPRQKGDDDGVEYGDPRDEREERNR